MRSQRKIFLIVLIAAVMAAVVVVRVSRPLRHAGHSGQPAAKSVYYCPMHPTYQSDRPGECPICHMQLVKREPEAAWPPAARMNDICTMHNCPMAHEGGPCPMLVVSAPGEEVTCPVCGTHMHPESKAEPGKAPSSGAEGYAAVLLSPEKRQLIGVKTEPARRRLLTRTIRTVGLVTVDETRIVHVHPKVEGWIEEIYAKYEGNPVKKGEPLFSFYSPDFISVQQEYLSALKFHKELPADAGPEIKEAAEKNLEAVRQRLLGWDVTSRQVEELESRRVPSRTLVLVSPMDGVVLRKHVWTGEWMERGADFYHIADLSSIWVDARLYESDLPLIRVGQQAEVVFEETGQRLEGKVVFVSPTLDAETRTAVARLEFPNAQGFLRPGQFATVKIGVDLGERLSVSKEAVLDTGTRRILFVDRGEGLLLPRQVEVGAKGGEFWEITEGISEGEQVVVNGNFLIDSESRLKAALEGAEAGHVHGS